MHNPNRYTIDQANQALRQIDANFDGRASKKELFDALKILMSQNTMPNSNYNNNSYSYSSPSTPNQYNQNQPYSSYNQGTYAPSYQSNGSSIKSSPNNISYQQSGPSSYLDANYAETSRVLQPNTLATNIQSTVPPVTVISSTSVSDPGYMKITTTTGPGGYTKITTETYSSSATYKYWFVNYLLSFTCSFLYLLVSYYRFNQEAGNCTNFICRSSLFESSFLGLFLVFWVLMSYVVEVG